MWVQVSPVSIHGLHSCVRLARVRTPASTRVSLQPFRTYTRACSYVCKISPPSPPSAGAGPRGKRRQMSESWWFFFHGAFTVPRSKPAQSCPCRDSSRGHKSRLSPIVLCPPIFPCRCRAAITDRPPSSRPSSPRGSRIKPPNFSSRGRSMELRDASVCQPFGRCLFRDASSRSPPSRPPRLVSYFPANLA